MRLMLMMLWLLLLTWLDEYPLLYNIKKNPLICFSTYTRTCMFRFWIVIGIYCETLNNILVIVIAIFCSFPPPSVLMHLHSSLELIRIEKIHGVYVSLNGLELRARLKITRVRKGASRISKITLFISGIIWLVNVRMGHYLISHYLTSVWTTLLPCHGK